MFKDVIEINQFIIEKLKSKEFAKDNGLNIYDTYRVVQKFNNQMNLVISYLSREINHQDTKTSFGTPTKKWLYFVNKQIRDYENIKYDFFSKVLRIDKNYCNMEDQGIFKSNFLSKALNGHITEYTKVSNIDEELQFEIYRFNLITNNCPRLRSFEELFSKITLDVKKESSKLEVIKDLRYDKDKLDEIIIDYEVFLENNYSIVDLLPPKH